MRSVCIREVQRSLMQSAKRLVEDKIRNMDLLEPGSGFQLFKDHITTPGDGMIIFQGMQDHNADSIKSLEGFSRAWAEEAQTISQYSLDLLRPTIRTESSELWFSWNPRRKTDPVDVMLRGDDTPTGAQVVEVNWKDNPWFPDVLEQERLDCLAAEPEQYGHIWEGEYVGIYKGAYYAQQLYKAKGEGRVCRVGPDPIQGLRVFCDIGGTGAKADAFTIWVAQFLGREIRVLKYYEAQGQEMQYHLEWMRNNDLTPDNTTVYLPHDGATYDKVYRVSYQSAFQSAGYEVMVIPNQGKGAASKRIAEARRLFPSMWFDEVGCAAGLEALAWYHEKQDEVRGIGLGPEHDWASHGADAFGLMAVAYEEPRNFHKPNVRRSMDGREFQNRGKPVHDMLYHQRKPGVITSKGRR